MEKYVRRKRKNVEENKNSDNLKKSGSFKCCLSILLLFAILGGLINACFGGEDEEVRQKDPAFNK